MKRGWTNERSWPLTNCRCQWVWLMYWDNPSDKPKWPFLSLMICNLKLRKMNASLVRCLSEWYVRQNYLILAILCIQFLTCFLCLYFMRSFEGFWKANTPNNQVNKAATRSWFHIPSAAEVHRFSSRIKVPLKLLAKCMNDSQTIYFFHFMTEAASHQLVLCINLVIPNL